MATSLHKEKYFTTILMNLPHLPTSAYHHQDIALHIQVGCLLLKHLRHIQSMVLFLILLPLFHSLSVKSGYVNTVMEYIISCTNKSHILSVLSYMLQVFFPYFCPYAGSQHEGKGYNTRESIRANSLAINLAFSRVCGLFEDKI